MAPELPQRRWNVMPGSGEWPRGHVTHHTVVYGAGSAEGMAVVTWPRTVLLQSDFSRIDCWAGRPALFVSQLRGRAGTTCGSA